MKQLQIVLGILAVSLVANVALIYSLSKPDSNNTIRSMSAEEASGIKNFKYHEKCNIVFGYNVCTSDFVGLSQDSAFYKAHTHGLSPLINVKDGKVVRAYVLEDQQPFRINFKINKGVVTEAFYQ